MREIEETYDLKNLFILSSQNFFSISQFLMTRILSIILLAFIGLGAVYGGVNLISDPTGWKIGLHTGMLKYSPFKDFLIPGIILFFVLGLGSLFTCAMATLRTARYPLWVIFFGFAIAIWISVQMLMLRDVYFLQVLFGAIGITLMILGIIERKKEFDG